MSASEEATAASAHDSRDSIDIAELYATLRREIRRTGATPRDGDRSDARAGVRGFAERHWAVTAERPLERRPGVKGAVGYAVKRVLRPFLRWYVEPLAYDQRMFNDAALKLIDAMWEEAEAMRLAHAELGRTTNEQLEDQATELSKKIQAASFALSERVDEQTRDVNREAQRVTAASRAVGELEERLTRVERRGTGDAPRTVAPQPKADAFPDYFAFESKMRGRTESVRDRQRAYVDDFRDAAPVLDVGCGRGEFLALLREAGVEARGIDPDADMVDFARGEGLDVTQTDAVSYLEVAEEGSLGGIFMGQVVEHLPAGMLVRTLELAATRLRPGGLFVAETINPLSPLALRNYFADLTHAQPLVPETLALLVKQVGFRDVETRFLNPPERPDGVAPEVADILFAPLDYAVFART
jgi:SAM-dependent methyltransferase